MGKGNSNTTTSQTTSSADPQAAAAYRDLISRASGVANTPYQAYSGELVAPINSQQQTAIGNINSNAGFAQPYIQDAAGYARQGASTVSAGDIANYQNPYTQSVVDATQAQFNNQNQQAQQGLTSNAIAQGALGGNRIGVASANLAGQQQLAQAPTIAGLYNNSYQQALTAAQADKARQQSAAYSLGNLGVAGQGAALSGAGAQLGAGTLQQQTQQAQDTAGYGQYTQQQAYPFQTLQWLAGLQTGVGSQLGGTSSGSTTTPAPSVLGQVLGLGLSGAGLAGGLGWKPFAASGGGIEPRPHFDAGGGVSGVPWSEGVGWVPKMNIAAGGGAPKGSAPNAPSQSQSVDPQKIISQAMGLAGKLGAGSGASEMGSPGVSNPMMVIGAAGDYAVPTFMAHGGGVAGFATGGAPLDVMNGDPAWGDPADPNLFAKPDAPAGLDFSDRFAPTESAIASGEFDPQTTNYTDGKASPTMVAGDIPLPRSRPDGAPVLAQSDDDDGALPPTATAASGVAGPVGAESPSRMGFAPDERPSNAVWSGLLGAGLGMLASRSPNLGNVIGDGGLTGFATYAGVKKGEQEQATTAAKLAQAAEKTASDIAHRNRVQTETERSNRASENAPPRGFELVNGKLQPVEGGPADPNYLKRAADAREGSGGGDVANIPDEAARMIAERYISGDSKAMTNLGRGAQGAANILKIQQKVAEIAKERGIDADQMLRNIAVQANRVSGARALGTKDIHFGVAEKAMEESLPIALDASEKVPRTQWKGLTELIQKGQTQANDPDLKRFLIATDTAAKDYARTINPQGVLRESDIAYARKILSTADSKEAYKAALEQLKIEAGVTKRALDRQKQEMTTGKHAPQGGDHGPAQKSDGGIPMYSKGMPREVGQIFNTPKGPAKWMGNGWQPVAQ